MPLVSDEQNISDLNSLLLVYVPVVTTAVAFMLLFRLVPNRPVTGSAAVTGGIVAALLFEAAKQGFAVYVTEVANYKAIYGAFAVIPVFLLWVYLSWLIILLGAEIAHAVMTFNFATRQRHGSKENLFVQAFHVVGHLRQAQLQGKGLSRRTLLRLEPDLPGNRLERILTGLEDARWIQQADDEGWLLVRNTGHETLTSLCRSIPGATPLLEAQHWSEDGRDDALKQVIECHASEFGQALEVSLEDLYKD